VELQRKVSGETQPSRDDGSPWQSFSTTRGWYKDEGKIARIKGTWYLTSVYTLVHEADPSDACARVLSTGAESCRDKREWWNRFLRVQPGQLRWL
jgi:hypothetical protein